MMPVTSGNNRAPDVADPLAEDRTTPQRPDSAQPVELERDEAVLRPVLDEGRDATLVLPRGRLPGAAMLPSKSMLAMALPPGTQLHEYRIDGVLGEGGFGITYLATDVHLNAAVAIKEYLPQDIVFRGSDGAVSPTASEHLPRYQQGLDSFLVEARTLASFRHRAIVRVARFFEANRTAYMVLEVEKGSPLKAWWPHRQQIGEKALVELLLPLLDGLAAVHKAGFLHRDIKPDNIQVRSSDGSLVLLDFGSAGQTAGVTSHGLVVVTPGYAPIEQYGLGEQGPWTDLYALGATLYWAISGHKPPDAETRKADPKAYTRAVEAGREVYGDAFLRAIDWALHTDPAKRPRSVAEFRLALCADHPASLQRFDAARRRAAAAADTLDRSAEQADTAERRAAARPWWMSLLMPRDWPLALKFTLATLVAAVLPMVAVSWLTLRGSVQALEDAESRYLEQAATQTAARVAAHLGEGRRLTRALATDAAFASVLAKPSEPARAALRDRLQRLVAAGAGVRAVSVLDAVGLVQLSTEPQVQGTSQAMRPWFQAASAGQGHVSDLLAGATPTDSSVVVAEPVRSEGGAVLGAVVLRLAAEPLAALFAPGADARLTAFMVDGDGVLVQHPHADLRHRSLMPLPAATLAAIRADQRFRRDDIPSMGEAALAKALVGAKAPGRITFDSVVSGGGVLAGYAPVAGHDWVVAVSADQSAVRAPLTRLHVALVVGALVVAGLMALVAWWLVRRWMRPIRAVTHALGDLRAGDYEDVRVKAQRHDEIGQLGRAFNALAVQLRQKARDRGH